MADSTLGINSSPEAAYATDKNSREPSTATKAAADSVKAKSLIEDRLPSGVTISGINIAAAT